MDPLLILLRVVHVVGGAFWGGLWGLLSGAAGMFLVPINHHLTGPEIAYIVQDSGAKVFIGAARFADACRRAVDEIGFPERNRFAVGPVAALTGR